MTLITDDSRHIPGKFQPETLLKMIFFTLADAAEAITVDDLLPALIFLIIKSDIPNWFVFIRNHYLVF